MNIVKRYYHLALDIIKFFLNTNKSKGTFKKAYIVFKQFGFRGLVKAIINKASNRELLHGIVESEASPEGQISHTETMAVTGDEIGHRLFQEQQEEYSEENITQMIAMLQKKLRFSIVILLEHTEVNLLRKTLKSVQSQLYEYWELLAVDMGSKDRRNVNFLSSEAEKDGRIHLLGGNEQYKDKADAYNQALSEASGDYIIVMNEGDQLTFDAFYWAASNLDGKLNTKLLFSDECYVNEHFGNPRFFFKPEWSSLLMVDSAYPGNFAAFKKEELQKCGGFNRGFEDAAIFEMILRLSQYEGDVQHVERVLYLTCAPQKTIQAQSQDLIGQAKALSHHMQAIHYPAIVYERDGNNFISKCRSVTPLASIIISTDCKKNVLSRLPQLLRDTAYPNVEFIIVTNSKLVQEIREELSGLGDKLILCCYDGPINYAKKYNLGASAANGEYLVFLRDNLYTTQRDWLNHLLNVLDYPDIGAVSPAVIDIEGKTIYRGGRIGQQSGELCEIAFSDQSLHSMIGQSLLQHVSREVHSLSNYCFSVQKDVFYQNGGLNELDTPNRYSELDFSFRLRNSKLHCAIVSTSVFIVDEHARSNEVMPRDRSYVYMLKKWSAELKRNSFFSDSMLKYATGRDELPDRLLLPEKLPEGNKGNILLVSHELSRTGSPQVVFEAAKVLKEQGYFPVVASPEDGPLSRDILLEDIPVILDYDLAKYRAHRPDNVPNSINHGIDNLLGSFDLVIVASIVGHNLINCYNGSDIRFLWWIHDGWMGLDLLKSYLPKHLKSNVSVYCGGKYAQEMLEKCRPQYNIEVLLYGVKDWASSKSAEINREKILFLFPATFETRKNQMLLLEAIGLLPESFAAKADFLLIGKVNEELYYRELENKAKELTNVKISSPVPYEQLMNIYKETACVVVPSIDDPMPVVLTEAMMMSKIVLCSDMAGTARYIEDGVNGFVFSSKSASELKQKIEHVVDHFDTMNELRAAGRKTYEQYFSQERFSVDLISVMEKNISCFAEGNK